jgi:hypothetical protein
MQTLASAARALSAALAARRRAVGLTQPQLAAATGATLKELMARLGHSSGRAAAMIYQHATRDQAIAKALGTLVHEVHDATEKAAEEPVALGLLGLPGADGDGMGRLPPQPPDNRDHAAASILEPEVPAGGSIEVSRNTGSGSFRPGLPAASSAARVSAGDNGRSIVRRAGTPGKVTCWNSLEAITLCG